MGKFRKAAPGGRKGGTGKKTAGAKAGSRKPSKGTGRGKGQSKSYIPEKANPVIGRGTKRKKSTGRPERRDNEERTFSPRRESSERGTERKSNTGLYQKREAGGRPDSRPFDDKSRGRDGERPAKAKGTDKPFPRREDSDKPERKSYGKQAGNSRGDERRPFAGRNTERSARPYDRKESSSKPRKGRSEGKFFRPGEDDTTEKRKRIGQDDNYKRSEPGKYEKAPREEGEKKWNRKESHELYGDRKKSNTPFPKKESVKFDPADAEDGTRLNKYIANAGICSRREADEMIKAGVISVNGEIIVEMGFKVQQGDVVKYNNETLRGERLVYILLNKPKDFITTTDDPEERKTVMNLIVKACKERVYPVGRLDRNTTGVLLFTNDGDIARKLTHPSFEVHKIYQVELDKALKKEDMESITKGITLDDGPIKVDEIAYATESRDVVGVEIHSGRNRIVRRIFEHLEYKVKKLDRVVFAGLTKKDLPRGRWRFLTEMEVANLKMITGKKKKAY